MRVDSDAHARLGMHRCTRRRNSSRHTSKARAGGEGGRKEWEGNGVPSYVICVSRGDTRSRSRSRRTSESTSGGTCHTQQPASSEARLHWIQPNANSARSNARQATSPLLDDTARACRRHGMAPMACTVITACRSARAPNEPKQATCAIACRPLYVPSYWRAAQCCGAGQLCGGACAHRPMGGKCRLLQWCAAAPTLRSSMRISFRMRTSMSHTTLLQCPLPASK